MCDLYSHADPALYHSRTRSLRLHGVVTTLRLEDIFGIFSRRSLVIAASPLTKPLRD